MASTGTIAVVAFANGVIYTGWKWLRAWLAFTPASEQRWHNGGRATRKALKAATRKLHRLRPLGERRII